MKRNTNLAFCLCLSLLPLLTLYLPSTTLYLSATFLPSLFSSLPFLFTSSSTICGMQQREKAAISLWFVLLCVTSYTPTHEKKKKNTCIFSFCLFALTCHDNNNKRMQASIYYMSCLTLKKTSTTTTTSRKKENTNAARTTCFPSAYLLRALSTGVTLQHHALLPILFQQAKPNNLSCSLVCCRSSRSVFCTPALLMACNSTTCHTAALCKNNMYAAGHNLHVNAPALSSSNHPPACGVAFCATPSGSGFWFWFWFARSVLY